MVAKNSLHTEELREGEEKLKFLVKNSPIGIMILRNGEIAFLNPVMLHMLDYDSEHYVLGKPIISFIHPEDHAASRESMRTFMDKFKSPAAPLEEKFIRRDGTFLDVLILGQSIVFNGMPAIQWFILDITERKKAVEALRESEERFRSIFETSKDVLYITSKDGRFQEINQAAVDLFGFTKEELLVLNIDDLSVRPSERKPLVRNIMEQGYIKDHELQLKKKDGKLLNVLVTAVARKNLCEEFEGYHGIIRDISTYKMMEETIRFQAYHDALTGLPNRILFNDRLSMAIAQAHRSNHKLAVLFLDLDRFKSINDSLGHNIGDRLLQGVADRLKENLREGDTVARMGGDEYTLLLPQIRHEDYIAGIATKIISTFAEPWIIYGHEFYIHSSIGISIYPEDGEDPETLIRNADLAMYHAKEQGRNNYQFYNPAMNTKAFERMVLENSLHHALERSEFVIHYQPQVDLRTGKISGLEALVRWSHPELGLIYPAHFIPLAEETGLIIEIGEWVLRAACAQGKQWEKTGYRPVRIAVNLSARQIRHSNLIDTIERTLKATDFDPTRLELEITENIAMHNVDITVLKLRKLSGLGIQLSIDDFGSGYSSLSYLKRLPIQTIKIDRSFMNDLTSNPDDAAIVSAVIAMSRSLNIRVVAEGVETEEQLAFLRSRECNEIQGFLFGAPQPAEKIETILKKDLSFY